LTQDSLDISKIDNISDLQKRTIKVTRKSKKNKLLNKDIDIKNFYDPMSINEYYNDPTADTSNFLSDSF